MIDGDHGDRHRLLGRAVGAVVLAAVGVAAVRWWGLALVADGQELKLQAVPWFGRWELGRSSQVLWAAAFAAVWIGVGPALAQRVRFRWLLVATSAVSLVWSVLLHLTDRPMGRIGEPLEGRFDYLAALPDVGDAPGAFLRSYTDELASYPIHVQGHPPGMVLLLWVLDRIGLGSATPAAVLLLVAAASTSAAVLLAVRSELGTGVARRAAPFLAVAPAAVWVATSADGLFMAVGAWSVTAVVVACHATRRPRAVVLGAVGGFTFAVGLHLTYGLAPLAALAAWVIVRHRAWPVLLAGAAGGTAVLASSVAAGFWLLDGLAATAERYDAGVASTRPYSYFVFANLAVLAVSVGPAAVAGLATLARRPGAGLVVAAVAAVLAADLSGLSKGEVERIWLPFVPWLLVAAGASALPPTLRWARRTLDVDRTGLALQAATGLALATFLRSPW